MSATPGSLGNAERVHGYEPAPVSSTPPRRLETETKASFKTTEFFAWIAASVAVLIAAAVISGDGSAADLFTATKAWLYVTILTAAYMVSRGLAKAGSRQPYDDDRS
jgi:uncharacterized membrane protein